MKSLLATIIGLAFAGSTNAAAAYVVEVATSIPVTEATDDARLKDALASAVEDVLSHAIRFAPTFVTVEDAKVVGDRLYILLLIADADGEEAMETFSRGHGAPGEPGQDSEPPASSYRY